ncbi:hypothetical protein [Natronolimnobius baerhuensis]|nr:hypothetical protein [Natronolimnobius baerhuensis]
MEQSPTRPEISRRALLDGSMASLTSLAGCTDALTAENDVYPAGIHWSATESEFYYVTGFVGSDGYYLGVNVDGESAGTQEGHYEAERRQYIEIEYRYSGPIPQSSDDLLIYVTPDDHEIEEVLVWNAECARNTDNRWRVRPLADPITGVRPVRGRDSVILVTQRDDTNGSPSTWWVWSHNEASRRDLRTVAETAAHDVDLEFLSAGENGHFRTESADFGEVRMHRLTSIPDEFSDLLSDTPQIAFRQEFLH